MGALRTLDVIPSSINRDAPPSRLGPDAQGRAEWSYGKNVRFVAGSAYSAAGESSTYPGLPGIVLWARWGIQRGVPVVFYVGATFLGCYDGAHHNITPAGWLLVHKPEDVTGTFFNDFAVINASPNPPLYVPLTHDVALPLPGWDPTWICAGIASYKAFLVALGAMTPNPGFQYQTVRWSDSADPGALPGEWTATPTNDAGLLEASQAPGPLIASAPLGDDSLALYKNQAAFALTFVGGPFVMGIRRLTGIPGALGPNAVYSLGQQNLVLTLGDLVVHNGIQVKSLLEGRARKYLFDTIDPSAFARCYIAEDLERGEVNVAYPVLGSGGRLAEALIWNRQSDEISFRDLTQSNCIFPSQLVLSRGLWSDATEHNPWSSATRTWAEQAVTGSGLALLSANGLAAEFLILDGGTTIAGIPAVASLERMGIPLYPDGRRGLIKRVTPRINGRNGALVSLRVGVHDTAGDAVAWEPTVNYTIGSDDWIDCASTGRYVALRVEGLEPYSFEGFRLDFSDQGRV